MGIRLAQEVGAHRKRKTTDPIEDELYKRVFWALVIEDIQLSSYMGRPRATTCEDIDLDPVIEAEDEYWLTPEKQPEGHIGRGVYFNQLIRIIHIIVSCHDLSQDGRLLKDHCVGCHPQDHRRLFTSHRYAIV